MSTWEDGPEYAPQELPNAFIAPEKAVALSESSAPTATLPETIFPPPQTWNAPAAAPLETLTLPSKDQRNPTTPYEVTAVLSPSQRSPWSPISSPTSDSVTAKTNLDPRQPLGSGLPIQETNATPAWGTSATAVTRPAETNVVSNIPIQPGWFPPQQAKPALNFSSSSKLFLNQIGIIVLASFAIAALSGLLGTLKFIAPVAYGIGAITGIATITANRKTTRNVLMTNLVLLVVVGAILLATDPAGPWEGWLTLGGLASLAALVTIPLLLALVYTDKNNIPTLSQPHA
ncbi:MAG: hypothetical protein ACRDAX_07695 [Propionibacteriaceae bacterium]